MAIHKILKEGRTCELDQDVVRWSTLHLIGRIPISGNMMMAQARIFLEELNLRVSKDGCTNLN